MKSLSTTTKLGSPNRMPQATISRAGANGQFGAIRAEGHRGSFIARTVQLLCVFVPSIVLTPQCAFFGFDPQGGLLCTQASSYLAASLPQPRLSLGVACSKGCCRSEAIMFSVRYTYAEWTEDEQLRQTTFLGWRDDKHAKEVSV
jgi:hypothetical protein